MMGVEAVEAQFGLAQVGLDCWQSADATMRVRRPAAGVVVYRFSGKMTPEFVPKIRAVAGEVLASMDSIACFFDTEDMSGYHPEFRKEMTAWHEELRDQTRTAGVLVRSRVIQMAISVASLATGGKMLSYSNRPAFEEAIHEAVRSSVA